MAFILAADAKFVNRNAIPAGMIRVGYTTGSASVKWPASEFKPADVRICQDHGSDTTADVLDVEPGAATNSDAAVWWPKAHSNYINHLRPGQRSPLLYTFLSNVTPLVNTLINAGIHAGPGLYLAEPNSGLVTAEAILSAAGGPFPIAGIQYRFQTLFDLDVFDANWYNRISGLKPQVPPGQWLDPTEWTWADSANVGVGMDGKFHAFHFNKINGGWDKIA